MGILSALKGGGLRSPKSVKHKGKTVAGIIEAHQRFVRGEENGARADLAGADLSRVNFEGMNLDLDQFSGSEPGGREALQCAAFVGGFEQGEAAARGLAQGGFDGSESERSGFDGSAGRRRGAFSDGLAAGGFAAREFRGCKFSERGDSRGGLYGRGLADDDLARDESGGRGSFGA